VHFSNIRVRFGKDEKTRIPDHFFGELSVAAAPDLFIK
jgi:hypothetical protein